MCNCLWKYGIEVQLYNGKWQLGIVWACHPSQFRALLRYVNGESDSLDRKTHNPPTRIRRMSDNEKAEFTWPLI